MVRPDGFVLAGGASRRMGSDKAVIMLGGERLADRVADALGAVCGEVGIVRRTADATWAPRRVVVDLEGPRHPLTGVAAALAASKTERVLLAPCDLVRLTADHVRALWAGAGQGEAVATAGDDLQPLLGVFYAHRWEAALLAAREGASVRRWVADLPRVALPGEALHNANHPADLLGRA